MNSIDFTISLNDLRKVISFLEPYIERQKKEEDWFNLPDDEEEEISLNYPYLDDKIIFEFYERHINVYVQHQKFVKITNILRYESAHKIEEETKFALSIDYLKQEIDKCNADSINLKEIPFFGFQVYNVESNKHFFDIEAFSTYWLVNFHPQRFYTLYPNNLSLEKGTLLMGLTFSPYSKRGKIDFYTKNGYCTIIAQSSASLRYKRVRTQEEKEHHFSVPSTYANRISDSISHWPDSLRVIYNTEHCCLYNYNGLENIGVNIEWISRNEGFPNFSYLRNAQTDVEVLVSKQAIYDYINRMKALEGNHQFIVMHFTKTHLNLYYRDADWNQSVYEFIDVKNKWNDFVATVDAPTLELLLSEISSSEVKLTILNGIYMSVLNPNQNIGDDSFQVMRLNDMNENNKETLRLGDIALSVHPNYKLD